jgi:hypothetical protein
MQQIEGDIVIDGLGDACRDHEDLIDNFPLGLEGGTWAVKSSQHLIVVGADLPLSSI